MPARVITQVTLENFHELVPEYIFNNKLMIQNYEDTKEIYLSMLKDGYLFTFDRDILIACLTDLTYMYAPGDDVNKDAVVELLVLDSELEEDDDFSKHLISKQVRDVEDNMCVYLLDELPDCEINNAFILQLNY